MDSFLFTEFWCCWNPVDLLMVILLVFNINLSISISLSHTPEDRVQCDLWPRDSRMWDCSGMKSEKSCTAGKVEQQVPLILLKHTFIYTWKWLFLPFCIHIYFGGKKEKYKKCLICILYLQATTDHDLVPIVMDPLNTFTPMCTHTHTHSHLHIFMLKILWCKLFLLSCWVGIKNVGKQFFIGS